MSKSLTPENTPCNVNNLSSRICELGTKSCTVYHKLPPNVEDDDEKRMNVVGSNGNTGDHYYTE